MQLLRDNLTLWTSDSERDDGQQDGQDGNWYVGPQLILHFSSNYDNNL
jgi:hypothetical protein